MYIGEKPAEGVRAYREGVYLQFVERICRKLRKRFVSVYIGQKVVFVQQLHGGLQRFSYERAHVFQRQKALVYKHFRWHIARKLAYGAVGHLLARKAVKSGLAG